MTVAADLLTDLGPQLARRAGTDGGPGPTFGIPADDAGKQAMVVACIAELPPAMVDEFLEAYQGGWSLLIVAGLRHPQLRRIIEWAQPREDVLFLAGRAGPTPPAVLLIEAAPGE